MAVYAWRMRQHFHTALMTLTAALHASAMADLPAMQRDTLPDSTVWALETELTGQKEQNRAVLECLAEALNSLLRQAHMEPSVESLVLLLTSPSPEETPGADIKELLMPRTGRILVSQDAAFALISTPVQGGEALEIFRNSASGITVHRLKIPHFPENDR